MPIMPSKAGSNTWHIFFSVTVNGKLEYFKEEFEGSIKEAIFYEMQIRALAKDNCYLS